MQEAYWSDPVSLAIPYKTTLAELFDEDNRRTFESTFTSASLEKHKVFCSHVVIIEEQLELCFPSSAWIRMYGCSLSTI